LRGTPFCPLSDGLPCRVRWAIGACSAAGPLRSPRVAPARKTYASQWSRHCRPRPHRQRRLRQQLLRRPGSAWASERDERARATSDRSCSAARRLSEFRVTDFHCAPAQFSFNSRGAIIYFLRPRSINNLTASDRLTSCSAAQRSTRAMSLPESRRPIIGRTPVAGRPRFFV
jgi:hypothetical protein